jgi:hypothetical protein
MLTDFVNSIMNLGNPLELLPLSPFMKIEEITVGNEVLSAIAWLVPFDAIIGLLEAWIAVIAVWYLASKILRWMKQIS